MKYTIILITIPPTVPTVVTSVISFSINLLTNQDLILPLEEDTVKNPKQYDRNVLECMNEEHREDEDKINISKKELFIYESDHEDENKNGR